MSAPQPPPTTLAAPTDPLARQLRFFKTLAVLLLLALLAGGGYFLYVRRTGQPVQVLLDGKPVATARSAAEADRLITEAETAKVGEVYPATAIVRLQKIELRRLPADAALETESDARRKLAAALKLHVRAFVIVVKGKPSLGLPTSEDASETLHLVKEHFAQMPPNAEIVDEPSFVEKVSVTPMAIDAARTRPSAETAAPYFWTVPSSKTYVVKRGDQGIAVARRNHLSLTDLIAANPGIDLNRLRVGVTLNVHKMPLLLTVSVRKQMTQDERIAAHASEADAGKQRVTYIVTYLDGQEIHRDVSGMVTLEKPRVRTTLD